jgi:hypothetical protein
LTLLSHLHGRHKGDVHALLADIAAMAAQMHPEQRKQLLEQLIAEMESCER